MPVNTDIALKKIRNAKEQENKLFTDPQYAPFQELLARGGRIKLEDLPLEMQGAFGKQGFSGGDLGLTRSGVNNLIAARTEDAGTNQQRIKNLKELQMVVARHRAQTQPGVDPYMGLPVTQSNTTVQSGKVDPKLAARQAKDAAFNKGKPVEQSGVYGIKPGLRGVANAIIPAQLARDVGEVARDSVNTVAAPIAIPYDLLTRRSKVGSQGATGERPIDLEDYDLGIADLFNSNKEKRTKAINDHGLDLPPEAYGDRNTTLPKVSGSPLIDALKLLSPESRVTISKGINKIINKATGSSTNEEYILNELKKSTTYGDLFKINSKYAPRTLADFGRMGGTGIQRGSNGKRFRITKYGSIELLD